MFSKSVNSFDFHCHVDLYPSPEEIIDQCEKRRAFTLAVTTTPLAWKQNVAWAKGKSFLRPALGLHPQLVENRKSEIELFEDCIKDTSYIGEVGLDGSNNFQHFWTDQTMVFRRILEICQNDGGKVISIHSRKAAAPVVQLLKEFPDAGVPILHWFSGTKRDLKDAVDVGCWFSVGPEMASYKTGRELISSMPKEKIVAETDAPFASVNNKILMPWDSLLIEATLSEVWGLSIQETRDILFQNSIKLLGIQN